jgi:hypothetical protein
MITSRCPLSYKTVGRLSYSHPSANNFPFPILLILSLLISNAQEIRSSVLPLNPVLFTGAADKIFIAVDRMSHRHTVGRALRLNTKMKMRKRMKIPTVLEIKLMDFYVHI